MAHENIIVALAPLLENNYPTQEICDFFSKVSIKCHFIQQRHSVSIMKTIIVSNSLPDQEAQNAAIYLYALLFPKCVNSNCLPGFFKLSYKMCKSPALKLEKKRSALCIV